MRFSALARWRVPLGFATFTVALWLAAPTTTTIAIGASIAVVGQLIRIWAAGHIEKGREVTRSGPYRYVRHPLYLGSLLMGVGFVVAAASWAIAAIAGLYFGVTYFAAIYSEEATLDERFDGEYSAYRERQSTPASASATRRFSFDRAFGTNKELRSVAGLVAAFVVLLLRTTGVIRH